MAYTDKQKERSKVTTDYELIEVEDGHLTTKEHAETDIIYSSDGFSLFGEVEATKEDLLDSKTSILFSPMWKQSLAASVPILLNIALGLTSGFSATLLPQLEKEAGPIPADEETASWIASIAALPMVPGCLISGWLFERFGRRRAQFIVSALFLIGWILTATAYNLTFILSGRLFTGLCSGLIAPLGPVYVGETSEPKYRGFFLAAISLGMAFGIIFAHVVGTFTSWQWTAVICAVFPILSIVLLVFIPESPTWLISRGRIEEGVKVYNWLRGNNDEAKAELKAIIDRKLAAHASPVQTWRNKLLFLKSPELIKPLMIMNLFFATCQFTGTNAVTFYSIDILGKAVCKGIDQYLAMLIIDLLRLIASLAACVICKKYGRRNVFFLSSGLTIISLIGLALFLYLKPENMSWIPLFCLMFYICAITIGVDPIPWIMCGEIFPENVRGMGSGISTGVAFASLFVVVKTEPGMMKNLGEAFTFMIYATVTLFGVVILYFTLPETKGKSLHEIEDKLKSQNCNNSRRSVVIA
ncbi:facilitated trehalose transporter Tret1-like isoform X1 [Bombyx mori]|uniref:facilitated trehalose transporter Tret1-like isoform X1 n=1 Tax=Bombyx mori TaxID=7091 RepID=UPI002ED064A3